MARKSYTPEEREQKRAEDRARVEASVRALLTSDGWRQWAETRASFHDYSFGNTMLIALQCPQATAVAGFRHWLELERHVRKGEKGIRIMAPMVVGGSKEERSNVRKGAPARNDGWETDKGPRVMFRSVSVFDVSQTEGEPLPEPPREPVTGDSHAGYLEKLTAYAASIGAPVRYAGTGSAGGYYSEKDGEIVLSDEPRPANARVRTLVHELAHAVGVPTYKEHGQASAEVIVETAAHIVCGAIGLDTAGESIPYIAGWGERGDLAAIRTYAETVDKIARELEAACA